MLTSTTDERKIGRNRSTVVAGANGLVFRKEFYGDDRDVDRRFRNTLYWDEVRSTRSLAFAPPIIDSDEKARTVVFPYLAEARSLQQILDVSDATDEIESLFARAGEILGELHTLADLHPTVAGVERPLDAGELLTAFDWLSPSAYARASGGELECWRLFQHDSELKDAIRSWTAGQRGFELVPTHGDIRPDQYLVDAAGSLALIDWEEFTVAPAHRDVAGLLGAILFDAIARTFTGIDSPESSPLEMHNLLLQRGETMIARAQPVVAAVLTGYRSHAGATLDLDELARGVGWYVIERVIARSMMSYSMSAADRAIAGIGRQALIDPASAHGLLEAAIV